MVIHGENLQFKYRGEGGWVAVAEVKTGKLGFRLQQGQKLYCITYSGYARNMLLRFYVEVKEVGERGIMFIDWSGVEDLYPWKRDFTNYKGETEEVYLVVEPCEYLFEKPKDIEKILSGEGNGIWYKHGGWRASSELEENLSSFIFLGQQKLF